ncbi:MAG: hypothetical protein RML40_08005 [Bacteroidota bacterium]|nr:hypothetical protein [Candidatus Kapabacteria bacterium]MDW8220458.1 hypothetical protein [Bacteroidota bacterium]
MRIKSKKLLHELKSIAEALGVQVILDKGNFVSGRCIVYEQHKVVLNKIFPIEVNIAKLAQTLVKLPLDDIPLSPAVRTYLEQERQRQTIAQQIQQTHKSSA